MIPEASATRIVAILRRRQSGPGCLPATGCLPGPGCLPPPGERIFPPSASAHPAHPVPPAPSPSAERAAPGPPAPRALPALPALPAPVFLTLPAVPRYEADAQTNPERAMATATTDRMNLVVAPAGWYTARYAPNAHGTAGSTDRYPSSMVCMYRNTPGSAPVLAIQDSFYQRSFWSASLAAFLTDSGYCR